MPGSDHDVDESMDEDTGRTLHTFELHSESSIFASCSINLSLNPKSIIGGNWLIFCQSDCSVVEDGMDQLRFSNDSLLNITSYFN